MDPQRPLTATKCDTSQPPLNLKTDQVSRAEVKIGNNNEVIKQPPDSKQSLQQPPIGRNNNSPPLRYNNVQHVVKTRLQEEQEQENVDQVVPNWPPRPDTAQARRDSVIAYDDEIQYKICSLKDYSQVSSMDRASELSTSKSGYIPTGKQLVKSLSQDRRMVGTYAKRMSECIYTANSRRTPSADEDHSSTKPAESSGVAANTSRSTHQFGGAESRIEKVRKLFVAPLSLTRPTSGKHHHHHQQQQQQALSKDHNQMNVVATTSKDTLPGTSSQQPRRSPMRQKGGKSFKVYGCPLHLANNIYPITCFGRADIYKQQSVPYVLARLCNYIEENSSHLTHEGIFRVNGNARLMGKLRTLFDHLGDAPLESESVDVATTASMLKMYLRELPEPLIPARMNYYFITLAKKYSPCLNTADSTERTVDGGEPPIAAATSQDVTSSTGTSTNTTNNQQQGNNGNRRNSVVKERQHSAFSRDLTKLVRKLPIENYNLLKYLACFLHRVSLKQEHNKMCAEALGIVFGPNVFRVRSESFKGLKEQELSNKIMACIISNYRCIFDSELTDPLGNLVKEVSISTDLDTFKLPSEASETNYILVNNPEVTVDNELELNSKIIEKTTGNPKDISNRILSSTIISTTPQSLDHESDKADSAEELPSTKPTATEADYEHDGEDEESYTISSGSESYCSSDFSQSLASLYDDDDDDDEEEGDEEDNEEEEEEEEEELGREAKDQQRGISTKGVSKKNVLNRKHISSSECPSDTSYTPTSSHSDNNADDGDEEGWTRDNLTRFACRKGSCAACTCREATHSLITSSSTTVKSVSSRNIPNCDKVVPLAAQVDVRRSLSKRPLASSQVQREGSRKSRPVTEIVCGTSNSTVAPIGSKSSTTANNPLGDDQPSALRKPPGVLVRRRSSSASSLSRIRRQSRQRLTSREEQRVRLQRSRIRRGRARGKTNPSGAKRLASSIQQRSLKNHIISGGPSVVAAATSQCISGSDRSYLAGDEVSSLAQTDEPESLVAQVAEEVGLRQFNSHDSLLVSVAGEVQDSRESGSEGHQKRMIESERSMNSRLDDHSDADQRGLAIRGVFCEDVVGEMIKCSVISLIGGQSFRFLAPATDTSYQSASMNEIRTPPNDRECPVEALSWCEEDGRSGYKGEESLLLQMLANKALDKQLKRLIRHAEKLGGFSHQMVLLVGRIHLHPQQHPEEENSSGLTSVTWHVDYLSTMVLASEIEQLLDQWTQSRSSISSLSGRLASESDNSGKLLGFLNACITRLNRRYDSLKAIYEHNLRNHSNSSNQRRWPRQCRPTLANSIPLRQLSTSEPSLSGSSQLDNEPPRASEPSLCVMQSSGGTTSHHHEDAAPVAAGGGAESNCCFGPLCPSEFVCKIEGQLAVKRRRAGRLRSLLEMSNSQLADEKLELQKNLLRYEHWFGRPTSRLQISLVGHIYERYRVVKQLQKLLNRRQQQQQSATHTTDSGTKSNIEPSSRVASIELEERFSRRTGAPSGAVNCLKIGLPFLLLLNAICLSQWAAAGHAVQPEASTWWSEAADVPAAGQPETESTSTSSELLLEAQWLWQVPRDKLCALSQASNQVNSLSLADNQISRLEENAFVCLAESLRILNLQNNRLESLAEGAFNLLGQLQVLQLENNRLARLPSRRTLHPLRALKHLNLAHNRIDRLEADAFGPANGRLVSLDLRSNPVGQVSTLALRHLARLKTLSLSQWPLFQSSSGWGHFEGLAELRFLHLDRTNLSHLPANLCALSPKLASLILKSNQLERVPELSNCHKLLQLDLSYNKLTGSLSKNFSAWPNLLDLYLSHNRLTLLQADAFGGLKSLETLDLSHNQLLSIHPVAFLPLRASLKHLNIAQNSQLDWLPGSGLDQLLTLQAYGNQLLRRLPKLPKAKTLRLTYAYHCCDYQQHSGTASSTNRQASGGLSLLSRLLELFGANIGADERGLPVTTGDTQQPDNSNDTLVEQRQQQELTTRLHQHLNLTNLILWPKHAGSSFLPTDHETLANLTREQLLLLSQQPTSLSVTSKHQRLEPQKREEEEEKEEQFEQTSCLPTPGPFLPCRDLFDTWWLRVGVWCVFLSAFTGNLLVIIVLGFAKRSSSSSALSTIMWPAGHSKRHIDVPRFLVINLALADLLMALYLGILALVDLSTMSEFKVYAIRWQKSAVCQLAGFLGVLSSELSVFILAIITLERNYAITNAVHLNRRLSLQKAVLIMFLGYAFAFVMALIPLGGQLADYRKYSICLPLELAGLDSSQPAAAGQSSRMYMSTLLGINTLSFLLLLGCYLRMYCAIRGSQAWNANDLRIAKRMSILVITDFLCWMPIIMAALATLAGKTLVDAQGVKALAIFVLPLNSIANPFLYAITTKKFKRDLEQLSRRLLTLISCLGLWNSGQQDKGKDAYLFKRAENGAYSRRAHYQRNLILESRKHRGASSHQNHIKPAGGLANSVINGQSMQPAGRLRATSTRHQLTQTVSNHQLILNNKTNYCYSCGKLQLQLVDNNIPVKLDVLSKQQLMNEECPPPPPFLIQQPRILLEAPAESSIVEGHQEISMSLGSARGHPEKLESTKGSALVCQACSASSSPGRSPDLGSINLAMPHSNSNLSHKELNRLKPELELHNRCASACANTSSGPHRLLSSSNQCSGLAGRKTANACGSCDITGAHRSRVSSRSGGTLNWLLLRPLAKAWSSIQISLAAPNGGGQTCHSSRQQPASPVQHPMVGLASYHDEQHEYSNKQAISGASDGRLINMTSGRRLSRSLDILTQQSLMAQQEAMDTNSLFETTTSTSNTQGPTYDDQRTLLGTCSSNLYPNNNQQTSRAIPAARYGAPPTRAGQACMRCRSWSPALFGKLEVCISQIKSKIPRLNQVPARHQLVDSSLTRRAVQGDRCTSCSTSADSTGKLSTGPASNAASELDHELASTFGPSPTGSGGDDELQHGVLVSDEEDKFGESEPTTGPGWPLALERLAGKQKSFLVRQQRRRAKLRRQQSSISDTVSTKTARTMLTNVGSSFESATNIPPHASSVVKK